MKNILVTGVSKGLGLEITRTLLREGFKVFGVSRTNTVEIKELMGRYPDRLLVFNFNLEHLDKIKSNLFSNNLKDVKLHGFINNAANAYDDIITNLSYASLDKMFRINVYSPMMIIKNVIRNFILHSNNGSIVHISSISVHTGYKGLAMYAASKGAIEAFSKNTAREWGARGIRSNCIVSGFMETEMTKNLSDSQKNRIYNRNTLKKPTSIKSVASTAFYLLSDNSESITGQNIFVDAGTI